jgi:hypothetical protein
MSASRRDEIAADCARALVPLIPKPLDRRHLIDLIDGRPVPA